MLGFEQGNKQGRGRPKGSKNAKLILPKQLTDKAIEQLENKVKDGDTQAILFVLNRVYPTLKAITPEGSLDAQLLEIKIKEAEEFEKRLEALEALANERSK
jgi:hypothetical protein